MLNPRITHPFENKILELIDNQEDYTRSDLQGIVTVLVNEIMEKGHEVLKESKE
jgi:hypothetical protein